jgi:hypothetical protein
VNGTLVDTLIPFNLNITGILLVIFIVIAPDIVRQHSSGTLLFALYIERLSFS